MNFEIQAITFFFRLTKLILVWDLSSCLNDVGTCGCWASPDVWLIAVSSCVFRSILGNSCPPAAQGGEGRGNEVLAQQESSDCAASHAWAASVRVHRMPSPTAPAHCPPSPRKDAFLVSSVARSLTFLQITHLSPEGQA